MAYPVCSYPVNTDGKSLTDRIDYSSFTTFISKNDCVIFTENATFQLCLVVSTAFQYIWHNTLRPPASCILLKTSIADTNARKSTFSFNLSAYSPARPIRICFYASLISITNGAIALSAPRDKMWTGHPEACTSSPRINTMFCVRSFNASRR